MDSLKSARWLVVFSLIAAMSVGIAACGGDNNNNDSGNNASNNVTGDTGVTGNTGVTGVTGQDFSGAPATNSQSGDSSVVDGGRVFAADSPWNTEIQGLPVDPNSNRMLDLATERRAVRETPGQQGIETFIRRVNKGLNINTTAWAPLVVEAGGQGSEVTEFVCRQEKCSAPDPKVPATLSIPANTSPDPRYDGWLSVIDSEAGLGYDFWRARRQSDNSISYQFGKAWSLDGPGFSNPIQFDPDRAVGARGTGLPLFAGLIDPDEASQGQIDHALAIAVPGLARRNFVQPASVTDGIGNGDALPAGARIRLRSDITVDDLEANLSDGSKRRRVVDLRRRTVESILIALRQYGAIVVDRSAVPTLFSPRGVSSSLINGSELSFLTLDDFEVIELPQLFQDPPLGQVNLEGTGGSSTSESDPGAQPGSE